MASQLLKPETRLVLGTIIVLLAVLLLVGGWTIPFTYESFSILYKFGLEKMYLRSGKVIGVTIAVFVFYQVVLISRFTIFEQVFTAKLLLSLHRWNGVIITFLVVCHPLLIKASESFTPYTFDKKYYPEFLGIFLLTVLLVLSATAIFRKFLRLSYGSWRLLHRTSATLVILLLPIHILNVSETFKSGLPRNAALAIFILNLLLILRIWLKDSSRDSPNKVL